MKLSTKSRYGLRALIDLALYSQNGQVALHQIAARQNLSIKYLEQDFATLRKAGLVRSIKGAQGGYILARPADQIRVGDIVLILEGDLSLVDLQDATGQQTPIRRFLVETIWQPLSDQIEKHLNTLTLADLAAQHQLESGQDPMYYI
ncbi:MAG: Rrf2 family transcriptional regulator [Eubacteriales bacterium]|nr:Rrf2 family transcriptional regulator [Eubacteriales bacterium]